MYEYKNFIVYIITLSFVFQLGKILLSNTKFNDIYKVSVTIIITVNIIYNFSSCNFINDNHTNISNGVIEYDSVNIKKTFENKLEQTITRDIHNKYYVNLNIDVKTDMKKLLIYVYSNMNNDILMDIKKYISDKYCTPKDEVILIYEN